MRIAIVGTGISGNAAAWALSRHYAVTVYEREQRPGGHSHTVTVDYDGVAIPVDIGFIVYNTANYPDLTALFSHLNVDTIESCMTFAVSTDRGKFEWKGGGNSWLDTARGLFAQRRALPLISFKIIAAIHWEALRPWFKGTKIVRRPASSALSQGREIKLFRKSSRNLLQHRF